MYRTCIFCKKDLGSNDVVEHFPVGRKLAFDEAKGRLWVVCKACGQWNLVPGLAPGQAVVSLTSLTRPLLVSIDPAPCRLRLVE